MKLALSNFAWDFVDNQYIFDELKSIGIHHIEGVLTKIDAWDNLTPEKLHSFKKILDKNEIKMESIQSIHYGIDCSDLSDDTIINHYKKLIQCCEILGVKVMVLGSPSLRKNVNDWETRLSSVLKMVDGLLIESKIQMSIEPNMRGYGGSYFFGVGEIVDFIVSNDLKNIKTMIDTHNIIMENQDPLNELKTYFNYINHIHISEPGLKKLNNMSFHKNFSDTIRETNYSGIVTYEVMKCDGLMDSVKEFYLTYN